MISEEPPFQTDAMFCPTCEEERSIDDFEFLGMIEELGNLPRFRCKQCNAEFEIVF